MKFGPPQRLIEISRLQLLLSVDVQGENVSKFFLLHVIPNPYPYARRLPLLPCFDSFSQILNPQHDLYK